MKTLSAVSAYDILIIMIATSDAEYRGGGNCHSISAKFVCHSIWFTTHTLLVTLIAPGNSYSFTCHKHVFLPVYSLYFTGLTHEKIEAETSR